jgi:hypothetical protein
MLTRQVQRLCDLLADELISTGRKKSQYRGDSQSDEWLGDMRRVLEKCIWADGVPVDRQFEWVEEMVLYAVSCEEWPRVRRPAHIHDLLPTLMELVPRWTHEERAQVAKPARMTTEAKAADASREDCDTPSDGVDPRLARLIAAYRANAAEPAGVLPGTAH